MIDLFRWGILGVLVGLAIRLVIKEWFRQKALEDDRRRILLSNIESLVINRLGLQNRESEFTDMVNEYLRVRYDKSVMYDWREMTEEEAEKVLKYYGGMLGLPI